jgi:hypothetical protein
LNPGFFVQSWLIASRRSLLRRTLGYSDWRTIDIEAYANREAGGILLVGSAGERLYCLRNKPACAGGA